VLLVVLDAVDGHDERAEPVVPRERVLGDGSDRRNECLVGPLGLGADLIPRTGA